MTVIEACNEFDPSLFLSASKDGSVYIWRFIPNNGKVTEDEKARSLILAPTIDQNEVIENVL